VLVAEDELDVLREDDCPMMLASAFWTASGFAFLIDTTCTSSARSLPDWSI
jgi:hypothetical protein